MSGFLSMVGEALFGGDEEVSTRFTETKRSLSSGSSDPQEPVLTPFYKHKQLGVRKAPPKTFCACPCFT
jgi:hypothetical protein